jgi:anaerobic magnesium-protoporphyrin IX monomethyl ester cyclase
MRIALVSPCSQINAAFGLRTLSSCLREQGHETRLIFLPDFNDYSGQIEANANLYHDALLNDLFPLCEDCDLIGLSLMTVFYEKAVWITRNLQIRLNKPVIWGGAHPTSKPGESLKVADMACIGEGEETLIELMNRMARGEDYSDVRGLWLRKNGGIQKNALRPLETNLDRYPPPDNSMDDHHILWDRRIIPLTHEIASAFSKPFYPSNDFGRNGYLTLSSRGCPHQCAYCHNSMMKTLYAGQKYLRWRTIRHFISELVEMRKTAPYINFVYICDDLFLARRQDELREFSEEYREKVQIPFMCCTDPLSVSEEKMELLTGAGMVGIQMGAESGSSAIQTLFNRKNMTNERMLRGMTIINRFRDRVTPYYDFIVDTPYETDRDRIETLKFISQIPQPYRLGIYALVLLPGTMLYDKAIADGMVKDEVKEVYEKHFFIRQPNYLNLLILLVQNIRLPGWVLRFMVSKAMISLLNGRAMRPVMRRIYIAAKNLHGLFIAPGQNPSLEFLKSHYD